jgi:hypothetical protein
MRQKRIDDPILGPQRLAFGRQLGIDWFSPRWLWRFDWRWPSRDHPDDRADLRLHLGINRIVWRAEVGVKSGMVPEPELVDRPARKIPALEQLVVRLEVLLNL